MNSFISWIGGKNLLRKDSTDWNSKENAKMWRKDLADTINAANEQLGIAVQWEHRSFKEQGIDREPTIHIGAVANALEHKGIQTERGGINREIIKRNSITTFAQLEKFKTDKGKEFGSWEQIFILKWKRLEQLKELAKAYANYEPYKAVHDMSRSLSGLKKLKYDREHEHELVM